MKMVLLAFHTSMTGMPVWGEGRAGWGVKMVLLAFHISTTGMSAQARGGARPRYSANPPRPRLVRYAHTPIDAPSLASHTLPAEQSPLPKPQPPSISASDP